MIHGHILQRSPKHRIAELIPDTIPSDICLVFHLFRADVESGREVILYGCS